MVLHMVRRIATTPILPLMIMGKPWIKARQLWSLCRSGRYCTDTSAFVARAPTSGTEGRVLVEALKLEFTDAQINKEQTLLFVTIPQLKEEKAERS